MNNFFGRDQMEYVLVYAELRGAPYRVLVVLKDKPAWQCGRLNLPGGKVEEHELVGTAALRELEEEAGLLVGEVTVMGKIYGTWGTVYCCKVQVSTEEVDPLPSETQKIFWVDWEDIKESPLLLPNLRVIIPLMMTDVKGWSIKDEGPSFENPTHTIGITLLTHKGKDA